VNNEKFLLTVNEYYLRFRSALHHSTVLTIPRRNTSYIAVSDLVNFHDMMYVVSEENIHTKRSPLSFSPEPSIGK
jgi:hypothetical protein